MEGVGAGFHLDAEDAAGGVAEFRVDGILLEVDFLDGIHGRGVAGLLGCHGGSAIEDDVVLGIGVAADIKLGGGPMVEGALLCGGANDGGGVEADEQEGIAVDDGQVIGHLGVDGESHGGGIELDGYGGGLDGDLLIGAADAEGGVDGDVAARLHEYVFLDEGLEAGELHFDGVVAGEDEVKRY